MIIALTPPSVLALHVLVIFFSENTLLFSFTGVSILPLVLIPAHLNSNEIAVLAKEST